MNESRRKALEGTDVEKEAREDNYGRDTGEKIETLSEERNPVTGHRKLGAGHSLPGKYTYQGGKPYKTGR